jgi:hypothetical protein
MREIFMALVILALVIGGALFFMDRAATIADSKAAIAREQTAQVEIKQQYATERWEAFLLTLKALTVPQAPPMSPLLAYLLGIVSGVGVLIGLATWRGSRTQPAGGS